jgi:hypothetical protein
MTFSTKEETIFPKAVPITTATARSTTLPLISKSFKFLYKIFHKLCQFMLILKMIIHFNAGGDHAHHDNPNTSTLQDFLVFYL